MLTMQAPAKINLTLEVLAKRRDGFHEIRSVIQTINLCDSLHFQLSRNIEFKSEAPEWDSEKSLVSKTVRLVQEATGCAQGVTVAVSKRIPLLSGLGGDSSDAAATLLGLNRLWGLGLSQKELLELALRLGSDVSFFLHGGTALVGGRGEIIAPLPPLPLMWVVLLLPPVPRTPGKTGRLYGGLEPSQYTKGEITERLVTLLTGGGEIIPSGLFNVFDAIADESYPGLEVYRQQFLHAGAKDVHLSGSGPGLFTLVKDRAEAEKIDSGLKSEGLESYLAETLSAIDQVE